MAVKTEKAKKSATKKSNFDAAQKVSKTASKKKVLDDDDDLEDEDEMDDDWGKQTKKRIAGILILTNLISQKAKLQRKLVKEKKARKKTMILV